MILIFKYEYENENLHQLRTYMANNLAYIVHLVTEQAAI
jgi:hypothetical protein